MHSRAALRWGYLGRRLGGYGGDGVVESGCVCVWDTLREGGGGEETGLRRGRKEKWLG